MNSVYGNPLHSHQEQGGKGKQDQLLFEEVCFNVPSVSQ